MLVPTTISIVIGFLLLCTILISSSYHLISEQSTRAAVQMSYNFAHELKAQIDSAIFTSRTIANLAGERIATGRTDRKEFEGELIRISEERPEFVSVYTIFERGVYGDDTAYINTDYGTETGRYAPYIVNSNGSTVPLYAAYSLIEAAVLDYHYVTVQNTQDQYVSAPYIYQIDNIDYYAISLASPIMVDGKFCGIAAVNILVDDFFQLFEEADIFDTGYVTLVTDKNIIAYSPISEQITQPMENIFSSNLVNSFSNMNKTNDIAIIKDKSLINQKQITSYITPIHFNSAPNSTWKIAINVPILEANGSLYMVSFACIVLAVLLLFIIIFIIRKIAFEISNPVENIVNVAQEIAKGNLNVTIDYVSEDEIGKLANAFRDTIKTLQTYISNLEYILGQIADNNLNISLDVDYQGDFVTVGKSIHTIIKSLSSTLYEMNNAANQMAVSASQMESSANAIAGGSSEQAEAINDLNQTIVAISNNANITDRKAMDAADKARVIGQDAKNSNEKMNAMITAMEKITASSQQISNIIGSIEEIASQTNLLSLNASIEAARAGEAGRGFAVVADQIRNLANESANAVQNTKDLINTSAKAVEEGTSIVADTSKSIQIVIDNIGSIVEAITRISDDSKEQSDAMLVLNDSIQNITQVVESNSAASEESAAISEEVSKESQMLKNLVGKFQLKDKSE